MSSFPISAALLDALVLAVTEDEDCYGYKITKDIQQSISVSESTLYPVLRRLQNNGLLEVYDMPYMGRNRRYYRITQNGRNVLWQYRNDWQEYVDSIDSLLIKKKEKGADGQ
ncbi:MAG: PadR family transcriptional regulator [Ruminococcus sp.]|jgi:PadR family transcriptional regulator PadR|nr:PadR family transcriptional regulator [Ruminococcus sp.]